jgi:acid stress-induced BolA-like protein IbaG/YrbA
MRSKLTTAKLQKILTSGLRLRNPEFRLRQESGQIYGHLIAPEFQGRRALERQNLIWDTLEDSIGQDATTQVGMILAYRPDEWNAGQRAAEAFRSSRASSNGKRRKREASMN